MPAKPIDPAIPNPDIVTVTLNPAIDETVFLDRLRPGEVNRARAHHRQAGGKGVNISAMLAQFGITSIATGFLGNQNPQLFEKLFTEAGIRDEFVRIGGEIRTGIKIVSESTRETTEINFPGATPEPEDLAKLEAKLGGLVRPGRCFVLAGSLPAGVSTEYFKGLLQILKAGGAFIAVDTHGEALKSAIAFGVDLIKPNHLELAEILDHDPVDIPALEMAATKLCCDKVPYVIVSLGPHGAFFASPDGVRKTDPPPAQVATTVGAGDSMLAGYLAGRVAGRSADECAILATVFAGCALENTTRRLPSRAEIDARMNQIGLRKFSRTQTDHDQNQRSRLC